MLRPCFIESRRGVSSITPLYNTLYRLFAPLLPLARRLFPDRIVTTVEVGRAMIRLAAQGDARKVLEPADIRRLAAAG